MIFANSFTFSTEGIENYEHKRRKEIKIWDN